MRKNVLAIVAGMPNRQTGELVDWNSRKKTNEKQRMQSSRRVLPDAREARLSYETISRSTASVYWKSDWKQDGKRSNQVTIGVARKSILGTQNILTRRFAAGSHCIAAGWC